jgi:hypothetical protein
VRQVADVFGPGSAALSMRKVAERALDHDDEEVRRRANQLIAELERNPAFASPSLRRDDHTTCKMTHRLTYDTPFTGDDRPFPWELEPRMSAWAATKGFEEVTKHGIGKTDFTAGYSSVNARLRAEMAKGNLPAPTAVHHD